jgi:hypothetical protein
VSLSVVVIALALAFADAAYAATDVTGSDDVNAPLEITPDTDASSDTAYVNQPFAVAQIQQMPSDRLVNRVTVGDVATSAGCASSPSYKLEISEYANGLWSAWPTNVDSDARTLPTTLGPATFRVPPLTLRTGYGYLFRLIGSDSSCSGVTLRTWAHDGTQLDGGAGTSADTLCQPTDAGSDGMYDTLRMWHEAGQNDAVPCGGDNVPNDFNPSMPTGWLLVRRLPSPYVMSSANSSSNCGSMAPDNGITAAQWNSSDFVCQVSAFAAPGDVPDNGWYWGIRALPSQQGAVRDTYLKLDLDKPDLATRFKPQLAFDSAEKWFPLSLTSMLSETDAAVPVHQLCNDSTCEPLTDPQQVRDSGFDNASSHLDIAGDHSDKSTYRTTNLSCLTGHYQDCTGGDASQIYWRVTDGSVLNPYRFIQYWIFYRYNEFRNTAGVFDHEGDWEGFAVAPSDRQPATFDYASFSAHGHWYSYLRDNLSCADTPSADRHCGTEDQPAHSRVDVNVANGSHANYPDVCSTLCGQPGAPYTDGSHDAAVPWGHNPDLWTQYTSDGLLALPTEASSWTFWPGEWGNDASPKSPGAQPDLYNQSTESCADDNDGCPMPIAAASARRRSAVRAGATDTTCGTWFGGSVSALACRNATLRQTVRRKSLGRDGTLDMTVLRRPVGGGHRARRRAATAEGISQVLGQPLHAGDRVRLRGPITRGSALLIRVARNNRVRALRIGLPSNRGRRLIEMTLTRSRKHVLVTKNHHVALLRATRWRG